MKYSGYRKIVDLLIRSLPCSSGMRAYAFGSYKLAPEDARDIDIILLFPDGSLQDGHHIAEAIRDMPNNPPFDVIALSSSEEAEVAFVAGEDAEILWP